MIRFLVSFILIFVSISAYGFSTKGGGLFLEANLGAPYVSLENPDKTKANYDGFAAVARVGNPFINSGTFSLSGLISAKYINLRNVANKPDSSEYAEHLGWGPGVRVGFWNLYFGADYWLMHASHRTNGSISRELELNYKAFSYYVGAVYPVGAVKMGVTYAMESAIYAQEDSRLSTDSKYEESIYMFTVIVETGLDITKPFAPIFK